MIVYNTVQKPCPYYMSILHSRTDTKMAAKILDLKWLNSTGISRIQKEMV